MNKLNLIYFSPTGTTQTIVSEIAKGVSGAVIDDLNVTQNAVSGTMSDIVIIGSPVYAGRLPQVFIDRLSQIDLTNARCILVVVYGNRAFEDSLLELKELVESKGGRVVGAGAFIGEHSLSNEQQPIAKGRPDQYDLNIAFQFGQKMSESIDDKKKQINIPGNNPYCELKPKAEVVIVTDEEKCTKCNSCITACPVEAIPQDNPLITDGVACLRCCACIKTCPVDARELKDQLSLKITEMLFNNCQVRKEPELFI